MLWSHLTPTLDLQMNPTMKWISKCLQRVDKAEISKPEHDAIILSFLMEENANHIVLKFCQF